MISQEISPKDLLDLIKRALKISESISLLLKIQNMIKMAENYQISSLFHNISIAVFLRRITYYSSS